jgi:hypothetical protein
MDIISFFTFFAFFACIFSIFSVGLSLYACILSKSLEKATHTVQMMPVSEEVIKDFSNEEDFKQVNTEQQDENDEFFRMV